MNLRSLWLRFGIVVCGAALLGACASYDGRGLPVGASMQQVRALMGEPAETMTAAEGGTTWEYPHGPYGRQTYMAKFGADGKLRSIEQVLNEAQFAKFLVGKTTMADVHQMIGRPARTMYFPRLDQRVWDYRYEENTQLMILYVTFNAAGIVTEVAKTLDASDSPDGFGS
jgi:outer membrane protein assembly factor BamE (lipoprotein component of BamABCDE complex)